mgnify:FL=1
MLWQQRHGLLHGGRRVHMGASATRVSDARHPSSEPPLTRGPALFMDATEPAASALPWEGYFHRDAVLFVIDAGMHMHEEVEHETAFIMALRAALRFMHIKLVSSPKDYVGIMLWNTDASRMITPSKNPYYPHTIEYARLKQVDVPTT